MERDIKEIHKELMQLKQMLGDTRGVYKLIRRGVCYKTASPKWLKNIKKLTKKDGLLIEAVIYHAAKSGEINIIDYLASCPEWQNEHVMKAMANGL